MNDTTKSLKFIHLALCAGTVFAYVFAAPFTAEDLKRLPLDEDSLVFLVLPIAAFFISNFLFRMLLKQIDRKAPVGSKLPIYKTASIIRLTILEGVAFAIAFIKPECILAGIAVILYMIYLHPTDARISNDLQELA